MAMKLPSLRALLPVMIVAAVVAVVAVIIAVVAVIIAMRWEVGGRNLGDVIPMPLIDLFSISVLIGHL